MRSALNRLISRPLRLFGIGKRPASEPPVLFESLKNRSEEEWRAALSGSPEQAAKWVYAAATYGNVDAQLYWAQMQLDGHGTRRDSEGAFRWFRIAAESRRGDAMNMLGRCYERGWGVAVDFAKAAECFHEAAEKSDPWARFNLACLLLEGKGVARDPARAFALLTQAAGQGNVKSLHMLGRCHENGWGCPRDMDRAEDFHRRSADAGDFRGQYRYGLWLFERGDRDDGLRRLRLAVDQSPAGFCGEVAGELAEHPDVAVKEIGARALARIRPADWQGAKQHASP